MSLSSASRLSGVFLTNFRALSPQCPPKLAKYLPCCVTFSKKFIYDIIYNISFRSGHKIAKNDY